METKYFDLGGGVIAKFDYSYQPLEGWHAVKTQHEAACKEAFIRDLNYNNVVFPPYYLTRVVVSSIKFLKDIYPMAALSLEAAQYIKLAEAIQEMAKMPNQKENYNDLEF
jgi:hypothetical protein